VRAIRGLGERRLAEIDTLVRTYLKSRDELEAVPREELLRRAREGTVVVALLIGDAVASARR
jgi:hypothetical protein